MIHVNLCSLKNILNVQNNSVYKYILIYNKGTMYIGLSQIVLKYDFLFSK